MAARAPHRQRLSVALLAVVLLGTGGLGYLLYASYERYVEVSADYERQASESRRLQRLTPYPEEANRQRYAARREEYDAAVRALQTRLAGDSPEPEKTLSATEFQGRLRDAVTGVVALARENRVTLPDGFYLGFEPYRTRVPSAEATPLLAVQLKGCEGVVRTLLQRRVERVTVFRRATLREEEGEGGGGDGGGGDDHRSPVTFYPLEVEFRASPDVFQTVVDDLLQPTQPFQIIRALRVKNEHQRGPGRGPAALGAENRLLPPPSPTPAPAPSAPTASTPSPPQRSAASTSPPSGRPDAVEPPLPDRATLRYAVGTEDLDVQLRLELARFQAP